MTRPVSALRNLGPRSDALFARTGIRSAEQLIAIGPDAAYRLLLTHGARPHFGAYWAIALAIEDRHWLDCDPAEKAVLRARFDVLKTGAAGGARSGLEAELDRLGVRDQPTISSPEKK